MTTEQIASIAHDANAAYCRAIGDNSQPPWNLAPSWQRESSRDGVQNIIDNPDHKPEDSHQNWLDLKAREGWVYGEVKDPDKKMHPCILPYEELPSEQKVKDALFTGIVKALM